MDAMTDDRADEQIKRAARVLNVELVRQSKAGDISIDADPGCELNLARALSAAGLLATPADQDNAAEVADLRKRLATLNDVPPVVAKALATTVAELLAERDQLRAQVAAVLERNGFDSLAEWELDHAENERAIGRFRDYIEKADAKLAAVQALADEWRNMPHPEGAESMSDWIYRMHVNSLGAILERVLDTAGGDQHGE